MRNVVSDPGADEFSTRPPRRPIRNPLRTVSGRMALVFAFMVLMASGIGLVGVLGARAMTSTIQTTSQDALPAASAATGMAIRATDLEMTLVGYFSQPFIDPEVEAKVARLLDEISVKLTESTTPELSAAFAALSPEIDIALAAHRDAANLFVVVDGRPRELVDFLNGVAVEMEMYLRSVGEAARFRVFDGILVQPERTTFARWAAEYVTPDVELRGMIAEYGAREADLIQYVDERIRPDLARAEAQFVRMNARRTPKVNRALDQLIDITTTRQAENATRKAEAERDLIDHLETFIQAARAKRVAAMDAMDASVLAAVETGRQVKLLTLAALLVGGCAALGAAVASMRRIAIPLGRLSNVIASLADQRLDIDVPYSDRADEIGAIARAAETFRLNGLARITLERQRAEAQAEADAVKAAEGERLAQLAERERAAEEARDAAERAEAERQATAERRSAAERQARHDDQTFVVDNLARGLKRLADGDVTVRIETAFSESYDPLRLDFNAAVEALAEAVGMISSSAGAIDDSVDVLSQATTDLTRRTEQVAASLEETSGSIREITTLVGSVSKGADEADGVVTDAHQRAEASREVVRDAVRAMETIDASAQEVSAITGVIDDISFQTNLLALNAGVEAARAGSAGRGFAIVAAEVRALAKRSAEAASQIRKLTSASVTQVSEGVSRVDAVGTVLGEMVDSVSSISDHVSRIAASCREQAGGIAEIDRSVSAIDQATRENSVMAEETTASTRALLEEAQCLAAAVARFDGATTSPDRDEVIPSRTAA